MFVQIIRNALPTFMNWTNLGHTASQTEYRRILAHNFWKLTKPGLSWEKWDVWNPSLLC